MLKIAVIGLGTMGSGMLANLSKSYDAYGYDENQPDRSKYLVEGSVVTNTLEEALENADLILLNLTYDKLLAEFKNILSKSKKGSVVLNTTTIPPEDSRKLKLASMEAGVDYLACPIRGVRTSALEGRIAVYVGGDKDVFEKVSPVLKTMSREVIYLGSDEKANTVKLLHNFVSYINTIAYSEAFTIAAYYGIPSKDLYEAFMGTRAMSETLKRRWEDYIEKGEFDNGYRVRLVREDLDMVSKMASDTGTSVITPFLTKQIYDFLPENYRNKDMSSVLLYYMEKHGFMNFLPKKP